MAASSLRPAVSQLRFCSSADAASPRARPNTACLAMAPNGLSSLQCTHQPRLRLQTSSNKFHSRSNIASSFFGDSLPRFQSASISSASILQSQRNVARRNLWSSPQAVFQWGKRPEYKGTPPRVIVVTSGKGGVGKTTMVANIGMCLARLEFKVVAIDCDVGLRNLDLLLGMEARVFHTVQDVLAGEARLDQALVRDKRVPNFELLCISKPRSKIDLNFSGKSLILLVEALREREEGCPDFILLDCPAGIEAGFITAITPANEAIIVTTPDVTCLRDADRVAGLLECDGITNVSLLVNRVQADLIKQGQMMSVGDVREMLGLPLLGVIPEDTATIGASNQGMPLVLKKPPTMAGLAMEAAAWRLAQGEQMDVVVLPEEKKGFLAF
ncbi:unnamed protein product [Closterium sp. Yama58-4]|nr:unnamed protein product [Closterium sp. Yama58-4]